MNRQDRIKIRHALSHVPSRCPLHGSLFRVRALARSADDRAPCCTLGMPAFDRALAIAIMDRLAREDSVGPPT